MLPCSKDFQNNIYYLYNTFSYQFELFLEQCRCCNSAYDKANLPELVD